jgi:hypothetical protein
LAADYHGVATPGRPHRCLKDNALSITLPERKEPKMNAIKKTSIYGATAAMCLTVALAGTAAAKQEVPFHGSIQGVEIDIPQGGPPPTSLSVNGSATGIATHLGRFTATYQVSVDLSNGSGIGSLQLIAANGDQIFTTLVGQGTPTGTPGINRIVEVNTITGGTGRFANAKGSFTVERLVDLTTGFTSGSFNGTISSPGSAH